MYVNILKRLAGKLLTALLTEKFIKKVIIFLLKKLAERTENQIDDEVVKFVEEAFSEKKK